ncbi:unnamed protein product [Calicophoron daubneyi]|uniref:Uncharacterized protein n=1 Tax=Calicophoron daubneyi TaxID=300641 RepID=A0AAV2T5S9_CALDB
MSTVHSPLLLIHVLFSCLVWVEFATMNAFGSRIVVDRNYPTYWAEEPFVDEDSEARYIKRQSEPQLDLDSEEFQKMDRKSPVWQILDGLTNRRKQLAALRSLRVLRFG